MRIKPILFSGPMVKAILEGRKTQTRRVLKKLPAYGGYGSPAHLQALPYQVGDILWVRETWRVLELPRKTIIGDRRGGHEGWSVLLQYRSGDLPSAPYVQPPKPGNDRAHIECPFDFMPKQIDASPYAGKTGRWRSPLFMPRWAARIWLEVTGVKVERVQEISEEDAMAEGIHGYPAGFYQGCYQSEFHTLWDSINAKRGFGWEANPYVEAVTFKRIEKPEGI